MKIAVVTDDHQTISAHFGRAAYYEVFIIEDGAVIERHSVPKANHHHVLLNETHQENHSHTHDHAAMLQPVLDCNVLITRGMGTGAYNALTLRSIQPIITDCIEIETAISTYLDGSIIHYQDRLH